MTAISHFYLDVPSTPQNQQNRTNVNRPECSRAVFLCFSAATCSYKHKEDRMLSRNQHLSLLEFRSQTPWDLLQMSDFLEVFLRLSFSFRGKFPSLLKPI
ncbi:hypothetical protein ILYODFUR_033278 [Ilyodon furcidens]|uniref:Uncharacterized protein n=1 Tax=Ilyodon furcidens TaxID=33524 RepID=A0ABV0TZV2_9TELE